MLFTKFWNFSYVNKFFHFKYAKIINDTMIKRLNGKSKIPLIALSFNCLIVIFMKKIFKLIAFFFLFTEVTFSAWEKEVEQTSSFINTLLSIFSTEVLLSLIFAIVTILMTFIISRVVRDKLFVYLERTSIWENESKDELIWVITRTVNITIFITWFSVALWVIWVDLAIFMWGIWFGIGFTLKTFLTNFIAWIIMVSQWVYHKDDLIEVSGNMWKIVKINALFTSVEKFDGVVFYVPNIKFLEEEVSNYNTNDKRRVEVETLVDYDTDLVKAKAVINKVLESFPNILLAPKYDVIIDKLDNSWILIKVRFWIDSKEGYFQTKSNITETINLAFKKSDINIPFPQITLSNRN